RDGNAGYIEERAFDSRRHGSRVEHVDARVQAAVHAADDQIGSLAAKLEDTELDAVGRAAFDGPASAPLAVVDFLGDQRPKERDRVTDAALLGGRGDDADVAQRA